jgi:hypothetical protein
VGVIAYVYAFFLKRRFPWAPIFKIGLTSAIMGFVVYLFSSFLPGVAGLVICFLLGILLYPVILAFTRTLEKLDFDLTSRYIQKLPFGLDRLFRSLVRVLRRISLGEETR